ncbi:MBL fold metallo-hydrolase [Microbacterium sp. BWT-B31]|uniref:MBL fold metallo-hydrolase n=1 Tax=Microbacterium sp. BWT-B31 TaxID=3232072 RepID=UPI0035273216
MTGQQWTRLVTGVLAPNAGPMTLDGTNSLVLGRPGHGSVVVVDPGPADAGHLERLRSFGDVELILLTHHHRDHTEAAAEFAATTAAPVRALDPALCIGADPLADGEHVEAAGIRLDVIATPGHTHDSVCVHLPHDAALTDPRPGGTMITGDTILGRGTTIVTHPGGSLAAYLDSLDRLAAYGVIPVIPAHGPMLADLAAICRRYAAHRRGRLGELSALLQSLGRAPANDDDLVQAIVDTVYADVDPAIRFAAEASTRAQLEYLAAAPRP